MLRIQNILYTQRLWTPVRYYDSYGSFRNTEQLPVTVPISVAQNQSKPLETPQEQKKENAEPKPLNRAILREEYMVSSSEEDAKFLVEENIKPLMNASSSNPIEERVKLMLIEEEPTDYVSSEPAAIETVLLQEDVEHLQEECGEPSKANIDPIQIPNHTESSPIVEESLEDKTLNAHEESGEMIPTINTIISNSATMIPEQEENKECSVSVQEDVGDYVPELAVLESDLMTTTSIHEGLSNKSAYNVPDKAEVSSLQIDTLSTDTDITEEEGEVSPALGTASTVSSISSMAPVTPTSIESPLEIKFKSNTKNSLFRRETKKLNSKRKHLTMKLKNAFSQPNKKVVA